MKNLKSIDETIHAFFNKVYESGKSGNVYFENNTLYSYGRHFELAKFIEFEGKEYLFINTMRYSNTTAKHQSKIRSYINESLVAKVFYFDFWNNNFNLSDIYLKTIIERIINKAKNSFSKQLKARENTWNYAQGLQLLNTARNLNNIFYKVIGMNESILIANSFYEIEPLKNQAEQKSILINETRPQREKEKEKRRIEKAKEKLNNWLKGENIRDLYNLPIHLRLKNNVIETTKGAIIPLFDGLQLLKKIKNSENVHGLKVGNYIVNGFSNDVLQVGCHKISLEQINLFESTYLKNV
jgi:hypothetical protein